VDFIKFWRKRLKHPFWRIYWGYYLFVMVIVVVTLPWAHSGWLALLLVPYFVGIPAIEILLLIRERRLLWFVKRFWGLWIIQLSWPCVMYALALQQGWTLRLPIAWLFYAALVLPFMCFWSVRMYRLGWL
jgi:hypothetical protein